MTDFPAFPEWCPLEPAPPKDWLEMIDVTKVVDWMIKNNLRPFRIETFDVVKEIDEERDG